MSRLSKIIISVCVSVIFIIGFVVAMLTDKALISSGNKLKDKQVVTAEVGKEAPDFALPAFNNGQVRLSDFKGKPIILYFFSKY